MSIDSERVISKDSDHTLRQSQYSSKPSGFWGYVFQIIFQVIKIKFHNHAQVIMFSLLFIDWISGETDECRCSFAH